MRSNSLALRLFSSDNDRELPAALMDTLTMILLALPLWAVHDLFASNDIVPRSTALANFAPVLIVGITTFVLSTVTTLMQQEYSFRAEPQNPRRSMALTIAVTLTAVGLAIMFGMFLNGSFTLAAAPFIALTFGLAAVPAAIRLTSPTSLVYRPEYFSETAGPIIGEFPA